jgi:hypothetical protein
MNRTPLLGPSSGPVPVAQARSLARPKPLLRIFLFVWLLAGLAFAVIRFTGYGHQPAERARPAAPPGAADGGATLQRDLDAAMDRTAVAAASLRRAEEQIGRVLPAVERNTLLVEKRRLENALAVIEAARRDLEQNRLDMAAMSDTIHSTLERKNEK